jgi:ankyrin repeat protein
MMKCNPHSKYKLPWSSQSKQSNVVMLLQVTPEQAAAARRAADARRAERMLVAAAAGDIGTVQQLLARGCPPDACDYDRRTGLMLAAANGQEVSCWCRQG